MLYKNKEVEDFINRFKCFDSHKEVTHTFTNGYCYWFAYILHARFPNSEIMYYAVGNHFACKICNRVYDVTGDITDRKLYFESWGQYQQYEPVESKRILEQCILKRGI